MATIITEPVRPNARLIWHRGGYSEDEPGFTGYEYFDADENGRIEVDWSTVSPGDWFTLDWVKPYQGAVTLLYAYDGVDPNLYGTGYDYRVFRNTGETTFVEPDLGLDDDPGDDEQNLPGAPGTGSTGLNPFGIWSFEIPVFLLAVGGAVGRELIVKR